MRSSVYFALIGSLFIAGAHAQSLSEHAAAAAGATIGTAAGKPMSNAITKIFSNVDSAAGKAAKPTDVKAPAKEVTETKNTKNTAATPAPGVAPTAGFGGGGGRSRNTQRASAPDPGPVGGSSTAPAAPAAETAPVVAVPEVVVKEPTAEEFASVKVGATDKDMIALLGPPSSRLAIPDDDGHLRETCQYWSKGKPLGTIRLDNGQVVTVEASNQ